MKRSGLGERVRVARQATGLTATDAAAYVGVKQQQWDQWENGGVIPSDKHRVRIAEVLRIDLATFADWVAAEWEQRSADRTKETVDLRRQISRYEEALRTATDELDKAAETSRLAREALERLLNERGDPPPRRR